MKSSVLCCIFSSLFLVNFVYSEVTLTAIKQDGQQLVTFSVGKSFEISCEAISKPKDAKFDVEWRQSGFIVDEVDKLNGRFKVSQKGNIHTLEIQKATEDDVGNYTCSVEDGKPVEVEIPVFIKPVVKLPASLNAVENEKLKIHCTVFGKPVPEIYWTFSNDTLNFTDIEDINDTDSKITLEWDPEKKIENAVLLLHNVQMWHRGKYNCFGKPPYNHRLINDTTMVRVKDKYAAVWPFLGICAEVFILCAIILIYEKKRNKTELEESDTDQSPDQKNTPDHDKDSNLRHRQ